MEYSRRLFFVLFKTTKTNKMLKESEKLAYFRLNSNVNQAIDIALKSTARSGSFVGRGVSLVDLGHVYLNTFGASLSVDVRRFTKGAYSKFIDYCRGEETPFVCEFVNREWCVSYPGRAAGLPNKDEDLRSFSLAHQVSSGKEPDYSILNQNLDCAIRDSVKSKFESKSAGSLSFVSFENLSDSYFDKFGTWPDADICRLTKGAYSTLEDYCRDDRTPFRVLHLNNVPHGVWFSDSGKSTAESHVRVVPFCGHSTWIDDMWRDAVDGRRVFLDKGVLLSSLFWNIFLSHDSSGEVGKGFEPEMPSPAPWEWTLRVNVHAPVVHELMSISRSAKSEDLADKAERALNFVKLASAGGVLSVLPGYEGEGFTHSCEDPHLVQLAQEAQTPSVIIVANNKLLPRLLEKVNSQLVDIYFFNWHTGILSPQFKIIPNMPKTVDLSAKTRSDCSGVGDWAMSASHDKTSLSEKQRFNCNATERCEGASSASEAGRIPEQLSFDKEEEKSDRTLLPDKDSSEIKELSGKSAKLLETCRRTLQSFKLCVDTCVFLCSPNFLKNIEKVVQFFSTEGIKGVYVFNSVIEELRSKEFDPKCGDNARDALLRISRLRNQGVVRIKKGDGKTGQAADSDFEEFLRTPQFDAEEFSIVTHDQALGERLKSIAKDRNITLRLYFACKKGLLHFSRTAIETDE